MIDVVILGPPTLRLKPRYLAPGRETSVAWRRTSNRRAAERSMHEPSWRHIVLGWVSYVDVMAHDDVWPIGPTWRFEASTSAGVVRGQRPTRQWAIRAARRIVHRAVDCTNCGGSVYAESRKCWRCGAMLSPALALATAPVPSRRGREGHQTAHHRLDGRLGIDRPWLPSGPFIGRAVKAGTCQLATRQLRCARCRRP